MAFSVTVLGPGTVTEDKLVLVDEERNSSPTRKVKVDAEQG